MVIITKKSQGTISWWLELSNKFSRQRCLKYNQVNDGQLLLSSISSATFLYNGVEAIKALL